MTAWRLLESYPPIYVRLLAKKGTTGRGIKAVEDAELAITAGIPINRIRQISRMTDWKEMTVGEILQFIGACGFDPFDPRCRKRLANYWCECKKSTQPPFLYIRASPKYLSEFLPLIRLLSSLPGFSQGFQRDFSPKLKSTA